MGRLTLETKAAVLAFVDENGQKMVYNVGDRESVRELYDVFAMSDTKFCDSLKKGGE